MAKKKKNGSSIKRRIGSSLMNRGKAAIKGGLVGAAAETVEGFAAQHLDFVRTKFWGGPALLLGGAVALPARAATHAHALAGAAGAMLAHNMRIKRFQEGKTDQNPVRQFAETNAPAALPPAGAQALQDGRGGMVFDDAAALQAPGYAQ